jgi:Mrp family chromosome partitioning ATPase
MPDEKGRLHVSTNGHGAAGKAWRWLRHILNGASPVPDPHAMYVRLAVQLALERSSGERAKSVLLTSPTSGDLIRDAGRQFAWVLAHEMGRRVLLVESNFGSSSGPPAPGVTDLLVRGLDGLAAAVQPTGHERVFTLPAGSPQLAPASFAAGRHAELIERACAGYDCVILIGAPVLTDPQSLMFAPLVDHSLLLAIEGRTYVSDVEASLRALAECKASGVGVVLTRERRRTPRDGEGGRSAGATSA